ncbi:hypothetical protein BS17DRAFT_788400 [Gyrodon lividus]|nr:hypothetical protein BS17DRAFT_788400 [Gyrodon lividus]
MGSLLSLISPESVVAAIVTAAVVYGHLLYSDSRTGTGTWTWAWAWASPSTGSGANIPAQPASNDGTTKNPKAKPKKKKQSPKTAQLPGAPPVPKPKPEPEPVVVVVPFPRVIPGQFEVLPPATATTHEPVAVPSKKGNRKKKRTDNNHNANKGVGTGLAEEGDDDGSSASPARASRDGDAPDTCSTAQGKAPASTASQDALPSQSRLGSSPSFDTDSSWTRIEPERQNPPTSAGESGARMLAVSTDVGSSDFGDSPVAERSDDDVAGLETGTRAADDRDSPRTLAERLVPRPAKTGVDDMLELPDFPTLARVMRVQPRADEMPAPGFTWEDYGDIAECSGHVNDADEEDEGEWGVVKGKSRLGNSRSTSAPVQPAATTSEMMTKKQRQNAKKRESAKASKADAEATRLAGLAKHKRELERLRIIELSRQGGGKRASGGMQATVDDRGRLVWD